MIRKISLGLTFVMAIVMVFAMPTGVLASETEGAQSISSALTPDDMDTVPYTEPDTEPVYTPDEKIDVMKYYLGNMTTDQIDGYLTHYADMEKHWGRQVVGKLSGLGILAGYNGLFRPNDTVQADEFLKMSVMSLGYMLEQPKTGYWAQPFIDKALELGLIENEEFTSYKAELSREQMARIIVRAALMKEDEPGTDNDVFVVKSINDYDSVTNSFKRYVLQGYRIGLFQGDAGNFKPQTTLTRAEAAAVVIRFLDKSERIPIQIPEEITTPVVVVSPEPVSDDFIEPVLDVEHYDNPGFPYYFRIYLRNYADYAGKGYTVKIECINYPEFNTIEENWGKRWITGINNAVHSVDEIKKDGENVLWMQTHTWYLDREKTRYKYEDGMNIDFVVTLANESESRDYKITGIVKEAWWRLENE